MDQQYAEQVAREQTHKNRLNFLKASVNTGIKKQIDTKAGAIAGAWLGASVFGIGALWGAWLGKKLGVTGIVSIALIVALVSLIGSVLLFILLLKGYCDTLASYNVEFIEKATVGMCQSIGSLQNVK